MFILYVYMFTICSCHVVLKVYLLTYLLTDLSNNFIADDEIDFYSHFSYCRTPFQNYSREVQQYLLNLCMIPAFDNIKDLSLFLKPSN